jgi:hypothetical protein
MDGWMEGLTGHVLSNFVWWAVGELELSMHDCMDSSGCSIEGAFCLILEGLIRGHLHALIIDALIISPPTSLIFVLSPLSSFLPPTPPHRRVAELGEGMTHREAVLASQVVAEGRALLLVLNKLDALRGVAAREAAMRTLRQNVERRLPDAAGLPVRSFVCASGDGEGQGQRSRTLSFALLHAKIVRVGDN